MAKKNYNFLLNLLKSGKLFNLTPKLKKPKFLKTVDELMIKT
jgi:hypothetical protein